MNRQDVRYVFEHRLLPNGFYEDKAQFVGMLLQDKGVLFRILQGMFDDEGIQNLYQEAEFNIESAKATDEVMMLKIIFPEPEVETQCYSAYMFFDKEFEKTSYFCVERGKEAGEAHAFICAWTPDGDHYNFGGYTLEKNEDYLKCAEIHMEMHYGVRIR